MCNAQTSRASLVSMPLALLLQCVLSSVLQLWYPNMYGVLGNVLYMPQPVQLQCGSTVFERSLQILNGQETTAWVETCHQLAPVSLALQACMVEAM